MTEQRKQEALQLLRHIKETVSRLAENEEGTGAYTAVYKLLEESERCPMPDSELLKSNV